MKCRKCGTNKLSQEFPWEALTPACYHPPLDCLRCVIKHVQENETCSQRDIAVTLQSPGYLNCVELLEELYPKPSDFFDHGPAETVRVVTLAGNAATVDYSPTLKVYELQNEVHKKLGIPPDKQRLLHRDQELHVLWEAKENATLGDYGVQAGDVISVLAVLCAIPWTIKDICFELSWSYPDDGKDVLDGSVFLYADHNLVEIVSYKNVWSQCCEAIRHSGDHEMDDEQKMGRQMITVQLSKMEPSVNRLFFTLSAYKAPAISKFKQPSLKVFDSRYPDMQLCTDVSEVVQEKLKDASKNKSIIMCYLLKTDDNWQVCSVKRLSKGYTEDYKPLKESIDKIVKNDLKSAAKSHRT